MRMEIFGTFVGGHRPPLQLHRRPEVDGYLGEAIL